METTTIDIEPIKPLVEDFITGDKALIELMLDVQEEYNFLPQDALNYIADEARVPIGRLYSLATFYTAISLTPKGLNHIKICTGTACIVRGTRSILDAMINDLGIGPGQMTEDGEFSIEVVHCLGACALGPVIVTGEQYHGHMNANKAKELVSELREQG